ncbi:MAG: hypothetical protein EAZ89_07380 [Bacteroidetes bacterium]|nr:MAG: hypothetical protein EAZ89_07380 [Bacteroidota bacterium]
MPTIRDLREALHSAIQLLKDAAGNDPVISKQNLEDLVRDMDLPIRIFVEHIYYLAQEKEGPGGRVTRNDLDKLAIEIEAKILDEMELTPEPLTQVEIDRMALVSPVHAGLGRDWKNYVLSRPKMDSEELRTALAVMCTGLNFNGFYQSQSNIRAFAIPPAATEPWPSLESFLEAFNNSPDQDLAGYSQYLENPQEISTAGVFFLEFVEAQSTENRGRAEEVVHLMTAQLEQIRYIRFITNYYEGTTYFVVGRAANGNLVLLAQVQLWN